MENTCAMIATTSLTDYQALFYNEWLQNPTRTDYNMVLDFLLEGEIDKKRLNDSLIRFVNEHLLYNSNVINNDGILKWKLRNKIDQSSQFISVYESQITEDEILKIATEPFDLENDLLVKFILIKNSNNNYRFINIQPHILVDGLSGDELIKQLSEYYNTYNYKYPQSIEQQAILHNKLSAKFSEIINKNTIQINDFWQKHLNNLQANDLRFLYKNRINNTNNVNSINVIDFFLQDDLVSKLKAAAHREGLTAYIISQIALAVSLHKHSGQTNIGISFPIAIQEGKELIYGAHVNTLIIDFRFSSATNLKELMQQARTYYKELKDTKAKYLSIGYISKHLEDKKILDLAFAQTNLRTTPIQFNNINCTKNNDELHIDVVSNIILEQELKDGSLHFRVRYKTPIFDDQLVKSFLYYYKNIIMEISDNILNNHINNPIENEYSLKSENLNQLAYTWSQPQVTYPAEKTVNQIFEEQVELTPDTIAVEYMEAQLTYRQLNAQVNQLASYLKTTYNIQPDDFICLCLDKSEKMLIAILAILKTGAAYVPISPEYPQSRINYILSDTKPRVIISNEIHKEKLQIYSENNINNIVIIDDKVFINNLANYSFINPTNNASSSSIAYIIYTSGTTGNPKGVMVEHKSIINLALMQGKEFNLTRSKKNKNCLWFANYVFDAHVSEIFLSILNGHSIYIIDENIKADISKISDYCSKKKIDIATIPPAILNNQCLVHVQTLITAGDVTHTNIMNFYANNHVKVINAYGPTESTVCATLHHYQIGDSNTNIGRPIGNTAIYVLDPNMKALPLGVIGELYIGGEGVARGYLNKPKLTEERFLKNPFQTELELSQGKNGKIYKTGDLVRYMPDGNIEYIGRNDFQVKIRGFRIELEEIAATLNSYPQIVQSSVITHESKTGVKLLVAYYMSKIELNESDLNNHMRNHLPEYMIPTIYIHLEKFPITINGKLDRNSLPKPKLLQKHNYVAPRNKIETEVCNIYANVLGLDKKKISIDDDFFRLGGDSITNIQVIGKLRQLLEFEISSKTLFKFRTIRSICDNIYSQIATNKPSIIRENGSLSAKVNLLPIQKWFFDNVKEGNIPDYSHWNQAFILETPKLDIQILGESIKKLAEYHDALRIHYKINGEHIEQFYANDLADISLEVKSMLDVDKNQLEEILTQWQSNFNIESAPLFHVGYFKDCPDGKGRIHFAAHHLIIDTVSWRIIKEDLQRIYQFIQKEGKQDIQNIPAEKILGDKGTSYRQWVGIVEKYPQEHTEENSFWKEMMENVPQENRILKALAGASENTTVMSLDKAMTTQLLRDINHVYNTGINDILLSAFGMALKKLTGLKENHILLEGHGREEIDRQADITHTVGWFTTMYPVRIPVETEEIGKTIAAVKDALRMIPANGIGYGAINGYIDEQLPKISFNYLGQFDESAAQKENTWEFSGENTGRDVSVNNKTTHILSVNGGIAGGELHMSMAGKLPEDIMKDLCEDFRHNLENIIRYLVQSEREYLTRADVNYIISEEYLNELQKDKEVEAVYLANSLQQGFIYDSISQEKTDDTYHLQLVWNYTTFLDINRLKNAWVNAQRKYSALRLRFCWKNEIVQIVDKIGRLNWFYFDLSDLSATDIENHIAKIMLGDRENTYNLLENSLFRVYLIKKEEDLYTCIFSSHHAIIDGWSNSVLLPYIHGKYMEQMSNMEYTEKSDEYCITQKYLQDTALISREFWDSQISDIHSINDISAFLYDDKRSTDLTNYRVASQKYNEVIIGNELFRKIKKYAREHEVTTNILLQYCWHKELNIYTRDDTTISGITVSGRDLPIKGIENSVGLFINTLPVIIQHSSSNQICKEIKELQYIINNINVNSNTSLSYLQKGRGRLFNTLFVYENYPKIQFEQFSNFIEIQSYIEKVDYIFYAVAFENSDSISVKFIYDSNIVNKELINSFADNYIYILSQIVNNSNTTFDKLQIVNNEQYDVLVNQPIINSVENVKTTIQRKFEEQVKRAPNKIAITYKDKSLTYDELNNQSNKLANFLLSSYSIKPDDSIIIALEKSNFMLIGILGILKTGAAYVPINPDIPHDRITHILTDTQASILLTDRKNYDVFKNLTINVVVIDDKIVSDNIECYLSENPINETNEKNAAYIIYTSGTTGIPKGVIVENRNVLNLFSVTEECYNFNPDDCWTMFHSYTFDFSVWEIWGALLYGGKLVIPSMEQIYDLNLFSDLLIKEKITILNQTPNVFYQLKEIINLNPEKYQTLRYIIFGGEALNLSQLNSWYEKHTENSPLLVNMYGITETTVHVTFQKIDTQNLNKGSLIGRPLKSYNIYVLDNYLRPVPVGVIGELYIGGAGVARGYLNRPELTEERFLKNPFQSIEEQKLGVNDRLYKTGDLGRILPNGTLEYMGRNDFQVKIRGYRIELGEIESKLISHPKIRQAVVIAREHNSGTKYLVAYYISDAEIDPLNIQEYLKEYLPEYMIPRSFIHMETFPLNRNGKLDINALPEFLYNNNLNYKAPQTIIERKLCEIYASVLNLDVSKISIEDDFFKLGGDSISSIQVANKIRSIFNIHVAIKEIFINKTIESLCTNILLDRINLQTDIYAEQGLLEGESGLLPIQKWFFGNIELKLFNDANHYNQSFAIKTPPLDRDILQSSITKLIEQHDAFRFNYNKSNGNIKQYYSNSIPKDIIEFYNMSSFSMMQLSKRMEEWQKGFDIFSNTSLFKICYIEGYESEKSLIMFFFHHLIIDSVSWRIIKEDLFTIYKKISEGKPDILKNKTTSYRQWVQTLQDKYDKNGEVKFWETIRQSINSSNERLSSLAIGNSKTNHLTFDVDITNRLLRDVNDKLGTNINDILLSALALSLHQLTGLKENHVLLEGHGRENIFDNLDITNTIGWFTTMYPVALPVSFNNIRETVTNIKENLRKIPNNGLGYGILYGYENRKLPYVTFNYLGQFSNNEKQENWSFVHIDMGKNFSDENKDKSVLSFNGGIFNGELQFYITSILSDELHATLIVTFKSALYSIIDSLSAEKRSYLTASDINNIISTEYLNKIQEACELENVLLANSLQQGFIFHYLSQGKIDNAYRTQLLFDYHIPMNFDKLRKAWEYLQIQYPTLRLGFLWEHDLLQIIYKQGKLDFEYIDISKLTPINQANFYNKLLNNDKIKSHDLSQKSLFRVYLIKRNNSLYNCVLNVHHSILDGWSTNILINELHKIYSKLLHSDELSITNNDSYIDTQKYIQRHSGDNMTFWIEQISQNNIQEDLSSLLQLSKKNEDILSYKHILEPVTITASIELDKLKNIKSICIENGFTVNAFVQYCWHKQLAIYSGNETTTVGMTVSGRNLPVNGIETAVGLLINTLPISIKHSGNGIYIKDIIKLQNQINDVNAHSCINLSELQKNGRRLFSNLFVYENYPVQDNSQDTGVNVEFHDSIEKQDYPLVVTVCEYDDSINISLRYAKELFEDTIIQHMVQGCLLIIDKIINIEYSDLTEVSLISSDDYKKIIFDLNKTFISEYSDTNIITSFERQVDLKPNSIAIRFKNEQLTYKELNERANVLADYLRKGLNVKPNDIVALALDRSEYLIISVLAVLKSGAAYLPIDVNIPQSRLDFILSDTETKIILTHQCYANIFNELGTHRSIIFVDNNKFNIHIHKFYSKHNNYKIVSDLDLAYVIYTSGTTGIPKGVMVEHHSFNNLLHYYRNTYFDNTSIDTISCTNYTFDIWGLEYGLPLISGGYIELPASVFEKIDSSKYSFIQMTPSLINAKLHDIKFNANIKMFIGGEPLPEKLLHELLLKKGVKYVINVYGPTETTIWSINKLNTIEQYDTSIGRPIANTTTYVLDANMNPLPIGAIGELYIGGAGVARGYLNRPELTEERFLKNPFQTEQEKSQGKNGRIYKTGDLVRYMPDGNIEYIGRNDFQVKIRGFRIELGEIEAAITAVKDIKQAVVLAKENAAGTKFLAAYYVSEEPEDHEALRKKLEETLPEYMVPAVFIHMDKLPLTINGKLDRRTLPEPEFTDSHNYVAPQNKVEKELCRIYSEVLGLDQQTVGTEDDFFRLGGNSILAIKLVSRINREMDTDIRVSAVFSYKTIKKMAGHIELNAEDNIKIEPITVDTAEDQLLSFAQERLWFLESYEEGSNAYNIPMVLQLKKELEMDSLTKALQEICRRHEVLRSMIRMNGEGNGYQVVEDESNTLEIHQIHVDSPQELDNEIYKAASRVFRLDQEWPIMVNIFHCGQERFISIVVHHIAFDGWSTDIFVKELLRMYRYYEMQKTDGGSAPAYPLEKLPIQYKDYALWQREYLRGKILEEQLDFWKKELAGYETLNLPTDFQRPAQINYEGKDVEFVIDAETSDKLRQTAKELEVSLFSLMLGGYYLMLATYSNQKDIVVGTPIANRHYREVEGLIGFFVNTLALRQEVSGEQTVKEFIQQIGKAMDEAQLHQDLPFEKLVEELKVGKDSSRHPIFQVMFGLQTFGQETDENPKELFKPYSGNANERYNIAKFDLSAMIDDSQESICGVFNYAINLFCEQTIRTFTQTYTAILQQISTITIDRDAVKVKDMSYLNEKELQKVVYEWNKTEVPYPDNKTIQKMFEEQVERTPDNMAVIYENSRMTYRELNERANRLANYLKDKYDIKPDDLVGLYLDRSEYMLVAILGVLKAGAAYVPISPEYPEERVQYIVEDTRMPAIITNEKYEEKIQKVSITNHVGIEIINSIPTEILMKKQSPENPENQMKASNLAYVIYTSGTTGKPKGVMVEHRNVVNLFHVTDNLYKFNSSDVWTLFHSYAFDFSVWEIWGALEIPIKLPPSGQSKLTPYILSIKIFFFFFAFLLLALLPYA